MTKRRLGIAGLLALGAVLLLCSCGGGSSSTSSSTSSSSSQRLTREQYAAKANALCAAFNKQEKATGTSPTLAQIEKLLPIDRKLVADVKKLEPPANEQADVDRVIALGEEQATRVENLIAAIKAKDKAKVISLIAAGDANDRESTALFVKLGITECQKS